MANIFCATFAIVWALGVEKHCDITSIGSPNEMYFGGGNKVQTTSIEAKPTEGTPVKKKKEKGASGGC